MNFNEEKLWITIVNNMCFNLYFVQWERWICHVFSLVNLLQISMLFPMVCTLIFSVIIFFDFLCSFAFCLNDNLFSLWKWCVSILFCTVKHQKNNKSKGCKKFPLFSMQYFALERGSNNESVNESDIFLLFASDLTLFCSCSFCKRKDPSRLCVFF